MLFTTILPNSICLLISIPYPNQVYDKQRKNISQWWFVCCMSCSEIVPSQDGIFQRSTSSTQKFFPCCQLWWRLSVNTTLISQFRENVALIGLILIQNFLYVIWKCSSKFELLHIMFPFFYWNFNSSSNSGLTVKFDFFHTELLNSKLKALEFN